MEDKVVRFRALFVVSAVIVAIGDVIAMVIGGLGVQQGLLYLMGVACSTAALGAYIFGFTALALDLPLAIATVLLVVLGRKRLPRWVRVMLLVGLAAAIVVPLGALGSVAYVDYHHNAEYERTMPLYTSGLHQAVVSGDVAKAEAILKANNQLVDDRDVDGDPVLALAVKQGNLAMVEMLIGNGADVNAVDRNGRTPLAVALERKNNGVVELLKASGAKE